MVLNWLLAQLPGRGRRALEAGCGSGRHTLALAARFDQVVGIDISQPLIDFVDQRRHRPVLTRGRVGGSGTTLQRRLERTPTPTVEEWSFTPR